MKLIRTSIFSGFFTFVKIASGFIVNKIIANISGPTGVAFLGSFMNLNLILSTSSNGAINNGVIKYTAEFKDDEKKLKIVLITAFQITIFFTFLTSIITAIFSSSVATLIFGNAKFENIVFYLGISLFFYSINTLFLSILNGLGEIKKYTFLNSLGSLFYLLFAVLFTVQYNLIGILFALVLSQIIIFFTILLKFGIKINIKYNEVVKKINFSMSKKLASYSLMALVTAISQPIVQIFLRSYIEREIGVESSGIWQGMLRISDGYLLLIVTTLNIYYLPKISSLKSDDEIRKEIFSGYKIIIPFVLLSSFLIYFNRKMIIVMLFSNSFLSMSELFFWQMIGDILKITSFVLAYILLAKAMTKEYIISEILFNLFYVLFSIVFINIYGLNGSSIAFALNYAMYLLFMLILFRKLIFKTKIKNENFITYN